ncbi:glycoside hydrolase family 88 protein [Fulvivirga maritima]|uniref:glycoside hydrolase family 88/105 protein n=1 Tax=Fulvivirga maritima TaxID=2904247 RepID=UPI001F1C2376|nr:glycoside hydrolase family 88 protein [Fulvivirga maritima]UII27150.1 glycoside hydrolase family 88 protein [Fulvivirga maritima]
MKNLLPTILNFMRTVLFIRPVDSLYKLKSIAFLSLALVVIASCSGSRSESSQDAGQKDSSQVQPVKIEHKNMAVLMAESEMKRFPDQQYLDFRPKPKWEYTNGLICSAMLKVWKQTGEEKFFNYAKSYADSMINKEGEIKTYKLTDYNIDRVNPGKFLIDLYKETGQENYKIAIESLRSQMKDHPRTSEGGFWHKKRYPHQMWLDGIYMGSPFLAKYAVNFNEPQLLDDVANQVYLIDKHNYDKESGLYYHGWDESREQKWANKETGLSENFWGRGMGWLAMALVDVLDYFPEDHPKRDMILQVADRMAQGIVKSQDEQTGVWYQVLNKGEKEGNYLESSASSMFTYFLLKGVSKGYIDSKYEEAGLKGYQGILKEFIEEDAEGHINITNVCAVAGLGGDPYRSGTYEYYINETKRDNDPKAVGPFIMASLWYDQMNSKM